MPARRKFEEMLPDLGNDDIGGSGFAIPSYTVHRDVGGTKAAEHFPQRLKARGMKLLLDFVPNHMAPEGFLAFA